MDNDQCRGYTILAMNAAGIKDEDIAKVVKALHFIFDTKTENEAEEQGKEVYYQITSRL